MTGSSPPVRGAHPSVGFLHRSQGLIPARAGSTYPPQQARPLAWAHPRPCGEHAVWVTPVSAGAGSSPPVRGAHRASESIARSPGLIPARAGSTSAQCQGHTPSQGSSPPVRGARHLSTFSRAFTGLIPARAGSTPITINATVATRAHPRPCGEHRPA